jgi:CIC family chloride channel protein
MSASSSTSSRTKPAAIFRRLSADNLRRLRVWILLAAGLGAVTGAGVSLLHLVIQIWVWGPLSQLSDWWIVVFPIVGLLLTSALVRTTPDRSTETTEDYIRVFHRPNAHLNAASAPWRLLASFTTIGFGGSMGLEGPSIYLGSLFGDITERMFHQTFDRDDAKVMLVAGAAAGISAIFKAPVTGIIFALEVPYRDDLARHALIPAMFASATSYLVFVASVGTAPIFPVQAAPLRYPDLLGSLLVGVGCGLAARAFIYLYKVVGRLGRRLSFWSRPLVAGMVLGGVGVCALLVYHRPLPLGPGYVGISEAARGQLGPYLLLILLGMKMVTTSATGAGNGVGGLFFPSVMMGAAAGGALGHLVPGPPSLFAVVGIAAFLGGAYKVPLAGVAFVAETTGAPGYIIPGLLGAALGYLVSGRASISAHQRFRRSSELETRLRLSVEEVMTREWTEVPPAATVRDFATKHATSAKAKSLPVAEAGRYLGVVSLDSLSGLGPQEWDTLPVTAVMDTDGRAASPDWPVDRALRLIREQGVDRLPVVRDDRIIGMITTADVLRLEEILDTLSHHEGAPVDASGARKGRDAPR